MIVATGVTLQFGEKPLFENVNIRFTDGNCYGLIGANGAGKSTFLRVLSGDLEPNKGSVSTPRKERVAVLKQNHYEYDEYTAIDTVMMGYPRLYQIMKEKEVLYSKENFTDEDGIKLGNLEAEFNDLNGWNAESDAAILLNNLGIKDTFHNMLMKELEDAVKVKVLLAQALFEEPDVLLLDEPTNNLDIKTIAWLEDFLADFSNTVIVASHDRHFLNQVCTHIVDVDFGKMQMYVGNYDFWYQSSQLALKQAKDQNKKKEEKVKELQDFIARFSANASKSKQATSRKKLLEKITFEDIKPSLRKYPYINFTPEMDFGNEILTVKDLSYSQNGEKLLTDINFTINKGDKIAFLGNNSIAKTALFRILAGEEEPDSGEIIWGKKTLYSYFPSDNSKYFKNVELNLIDWLRQFSVEKGESFVRGFLGRMLFSGEDTFKRAKVLSGGEKVRCMLSKMMLSGANTIILDEPTNHLDLESITSLNNGLVDTKCIVMFTSQDHEFIQTIANRIIEITPDGMIDKVTTYDEYIQSKEEFMLEALPPNHR